MLGVALDVRTAQLELELHKRFSRINGFAAGVRGALGGDPDMKLEPDDVPVLAYLFRQENDYLVTWLVTTSAFVVHEFGKTGDTLTVAVPLWRVRRLVEAKVGGKLTVTVEIDADRSALSADGLFQPPAAAWQAAQDGAPVGDSLGRFSVSGALWPASYAAEAQNPNEEKALRSFARVMRAVIVAGG